MGLSSLCPQVTVVPSSNPAQDAASFQMLFEGYGQEDQTSKNSVSLTRKDNDDIKSMVIFCRVDDVGSLPSVLLLDSPLTRFDGEKGIRVLHSTPNDLSNNQATAVLMQFDGGGLMLVAQKQVITSNRLAQWLLNPESISVEDDSMEDVMLGALPVQSSSRAVLQRKTSYQESPRLSSSRKSNGSAIMTEGRPLPKFPTLQVTANNNTFPLNSPEAIPVENDLFRGKFLLLLRPPNPAQDDPYWNERVFAKKKRRFILQIQGKFKREPRGVLYAGAEISEPMKLGLLAKGVCNLLLKFLNNFNKVHYSFGDKDENAHISVSAWTAFSDVVVTKPGETPPTLGDDVVESKESKAARKSSNQHGNWNTTDIFTLSYHDMYIDLPTWSVKQLPFAPCLDLRTFWGKSFLNICMYDTLPNTKQHLQHENEYFFNMRIQFLGLNADKDEEMESSMPFSLRTRSISATNLGQELDESNSVETDSPEPIVEEFDGEEFYFFDAEEPDDSEILSQFSNRSNRQLGSIETQNLLHTIDQVCPMWIDMYIKGKFVRTYAINVGGRVIFRFSPTLSDYFDMQEAKLAAERRWSPRLSSCERTRRVVGQVISSAMSDPLKIDKLKKFVAAKTPMCANFLRRVPPAMPTKRARLIKKSAFVARAFSDHHWIEEWMKVTDLQLSFYHPERPQKANLQLSLQNIRTVRKLQSKDAPTLPSYSFMEIQTLVQTVYLMFASEELCNVWLAYLGTVIRHGDVQLEVQSKDSSVPESLIAVDNPSKDFLHNSSMWNCKQRRILNCRKFAFQTCMESLDPLSLVEDAIRKGLDPKEESEESNLCAFLNSAAALKQVDVTVLGESERLCFFLNLYHVMIVHAYLVLGPPDSSFQWLSYFNTIAYQCSDEIFSLTELEHNIIRSAMHLPSQFVSKFVLPKSRFHFALKRADYRINFALNCGSYSNPSSVPVYRPETLDEQLDAASSTYLKVVEVLTQKRNSVALALLTNSTLTVTLPRICAWFGDDFGDGSNNDVLKRVEPYLSASQRKLLLSCWDAKNATYEDVSIKYLAFSFECRNLKLCRDKVDSTFEL